MYLNKRRGIYQFRKPVPKDLVGIIGRADLRVSFGTTLAPVARRRAFDMLVRVDEIFELLRSEKPGDESRRLAVRMLEEAAGAVRGMPWQVERRLKALNGTIAKIRVQEGRQEAAEADLALQASLDRLEGKIALRVHEAVADGHKARYSAELLSTEIEAYKTTILADMEDGKHKVDIPGRLSFFLAVVGDMPVREIGRGHIKKFCRLLDQLPAKFQQHFPGVAPADVIKRNSERATPHPLLDPEMINLKYLGPTRHDHHLRETWS